MNFLHHILGLKLLILVGLILKSNPPEIKRTWGFVGNFQMNHNL